MVKKGDERRPTTRYCHSWKIDTVTHKRLTWKNIARAVQGKLGGKSKRRRGTRGKGRKISYG